MRSIEASFKGPIFLRTTRLSPLFRKLGSRVWGLGSRIYMFRVFAPETFHPKPDT